MFTSSVPSNVFSQPQPLRTAAANATIAFGGFRLVLEDKKAGRVSEADAAWVLYIRGILTGQEVLPYFTESQIFWLQAYMNAEAYSPEDRRLFTLVQTANRELAAFQLRLAGQYDAEAWTLAQPLPAYEEAETENGDWGGEAELPLDTQLSYAEDMAELAFHDYMASRISFEEYTEQIQDVHSAVKTLRDRIAAGER